MSDDHRDWTKGVQLDLEINALAEQLKPEDCMEIWNEMVAERMPHKIDYWTRSINYWEQFEC